jgi:hypothetical protein
VNLSKAFKGAAADFQAGTANGQVVYTRRSSRPWTASDPGRRQIAGRRAQARGLPGEGSCRDLRRPAGLGRVDRPGPRERPPNVFRRRSASAARRQGGVLVDKRVMASCGTGCWGKFRTDLSYTVDKAQYGTLRVSTCPRRTARQHVTDTGSGSRQRALTAGSIRSITQRRYWAPDGCSPSGATSAGSAAASSRSRGSRPRTRRPLAAGVGEIRLPRRCRRAGRPVAIGRAIGVTV